MSNYDNNLQVILKKADPRKYKKNPPKYIIEVDFSGRKYSTGLWIWTRKDGTPVLDTNGNAMLQGKLQEWDSENPGKERRRPALGPANALPTAVDRAFEAAHEKMRGGQDDEFEDDIPF